MYLSLINYNTICIKKRKQKLQKKKADTGNTFTEIYSNGMGLIFCEY